MSAPEIEALTQARRLGDAERMARELVAVSLDVPMDGVSVAVTLEGLDGVPDIEGRLAQIAKDRASAAEMERRASETSAALARDLARADIPLRDVGAILGLSHQRAHQLVSG